MNSFEQLRDRANSAIRRAWTTMGIPFDVSMVDEKREGIIDVEALLIITLLLMERDRMVTDIPAWINSFSHVLNNQKLKSLFNASPNRFRNAILDNVKQARFFTACPNSFIKIFGLKGPASTKILETIEMRSSRLNSLENLVRSSIMLKNRLLYGTGFRADLISLIHVRNLKLNGKQLARILCTADSTISRILSDLRTCGFLNADNEMVKQLNTFPGMFLSTQSVWNFFELLDSEAFRENDLKRAAYENLKFKHDRFCMQLVRADSAPAKRAANKP
ncbi:MAG: hypothetical protein K8R45_04900 [Desulfobacterales bacterium]|nr:hypothetical protein [Desulfobacterales bacterium]